MGTTAKTFAPGDRVTLLNPSITTGQKGAGTVVFLEDSGHGFRVQLDAMEPGYLVECCEHEVRERRNPRREEWASYCATLFLGRRGLLKGSDGEAAPRFASITLSEVPEYVPPEYPKVRKLGARKFGLELEDGREYECEARPLRAMALLHHLSEKTWADVEFVRLGMERIAEACGWDICH
jgi:hypothetical protein